MWRRASLGLLAVLCGCAARTPDSGRLVQGITGGVADSEHTAVFLVAEYTDQGLNAFCSSTLIAPNLILTAHHCVVGALPSGGVQCGVTQFGPAVAATELFASNDEVVDQNTVFYPAQAVDVPPGGDGCGFDLALITLAQTVPAASATPTVPRIDRRAASGETYTASGYGEDSSGSADSAGSRRELSDRTVVCAPGTCGQPAASSEFFGGDGVCEGDSGSPALDQDGKVMGVLSRGYQCAQPIYSSVSAWSDWIISVATQAAQVGGYQPPFWTNGKSDPAGAGGSAGAAAGAGGGAGTTPGEQGSSCSKPSDCSVGFGCYSPTGQASNGYCAADCTSQACGAGLSCNSNFKVCLAAAPASHDSGSCAFVAAPRESRSLGALALVLLALVGRARARRRRVPE